MGKRSGVIQILLACGCMLVVGAIVLVAGLTWFFFFRSTTPAGPPPLTDSGQVTALVEQILPGAEPPPGHVGFLGQASGNVTVAFLGPAGMTKESTLQPTQLLISMVSFPAGTMTRDNAEGLLRLALNGYGYAIWKGAGKVLEEQPGELHPAFGELSFIRRTLDGSPRLLQYSMLLENSVGRTVVLMVDGPLDSFNMPAMEAFLNKLQARPLGSPVRVPAGTPTPTDEPPTPEATPEETPEIAPEDTPAPVVHPTPPKRSLRKKPK